MNVAELKNIDTIRQAAKLNDACREKYLKLYEDAKKQINKNVPYEYRKFLIMRYLDGISVSSIAEFQNYTKSSIHKKIRKGLLYFERKGI